LATDLRNACSQFLKGALKCLSHGTGVVRTDQGSWARLRDIHEVFDRFGYLWLSGAEERNVWGLAHQLVQDDWEVNSQWNQFLHLHRVPSLCPQDQTGSNLSHHHLTRFRSHTPNCSQSSSDGIIVGMFG
jgi:hypothetical protein